MQSVRRILFAIIPAVLWLFPVLFAGATSPPTFIGIVGTNAGIFDDIGKTAIDAQGNIYICDRANPRIQKFDAQGNYLRFYGGYGKGPGQFNYPTAVTIDSQGYLYVADIKNRRIQKLNQDGAMQLEIMNPTHTHYSAA